MHVGHAISVRSSLLALSLLGALTGCGQGTENPPIEGPPRICGQADYDAAVRHAAAPTQSDIVNNLFAISRDNNQILWNPANSSQVLMVQWTSFTGYPAAGGSTTLSRDIFVTAAPQVKTFCKALATDVQGARLVEYLGLAPESSDATAKRNMVEMWVNTSDLFRPCASPDIATTTCPLTFPSGVDATHKAWIANQYANSYGFWLTTKYP